MKKTMKLLGIIAIVVIIGLAFITCDDGNSSSVDSKKKGGNPVDPIKPVDPVIPDDTKKPTEGLAYELIKGNTEYMVSLGDAIALGEVVIPAVYNGLPVTAIADEGFIGCSNMTSIIIPNSITDIGANSLKGCTGLTSITIPFTGASLNGTANTHFGYLFGAENSYNQKSLIPSSLETVIITGERLVSYAFRDCDLKYIYIEGMTVIGENAFYECKLENVYIPEGVTVIGFAVFSDCMLINIYIPKSLEKIERSAFSRFINDGYNNYPKNVFYNGDIDAWEEIDIGAYNWALNRSSLDSATIYYNYDYDWY